jgi:monoamine oxidase
MRASHDDLHFTGAELASVYPGFIEGAIRAGHETAARIHDGG